MGDATELGPDLTASDHAAFVLQHPWMSRWIKNAVREAMDEDPLSVLNDIEVLCVIMLQKAAEHRNTDRR